MQENVLRNPFDREFRQLAAGRWNAAPGWDARVPHDRPERNGLRGGSVGGTTDFQRMGWLPCLRDRERPPRVRLVVQEAVGKKAVASVRRGLYDHEVTNLARSAGRSMAWRRTDSSVNLVEGPLPAHRISLNRDWDLALDADCRPGIRIKSESKSKSGRLRLVAPEQFKNEQVTLSMNASDTPWGIAVYALVRNPDGQILLLQRTSAARRNPGKWDLPGGRLDPGERLDEGLRREALEETGLELEIDALYGSSEFALPGLRVACLVFEARCAGSAVQLSAEHDAFAWVTPAALAGADLCSHFEWLRPRFAPRM